VEQLRRELLAAEDTASSSNQSGGGVSQEDHDQVRSELAVALAKLEARRSVSPERSVQAAVEEEIKALSEEVGFLTARLARAEAEHRERLEAAEQHSEGLLEEQRGLERVLATMEGELMEVRSEVVPLEESLVEEATRHGEVEAVLQAQLADLHHESDSLRAALLEAEDTISDTQLSKQRLGEDSTLTRSQLCRLRLWILQSVAMLWARHGMESGFCRWREHIVGGLAMREVQYAEVEVEAVHKAMASCAGKAQRHRWLAYGLAHWSRARSMAQGELQASWQTSRTQRQAAAALRAAGRVLWRLARSRLSFFFSLWGQDVRSDFGSRGMVVACDRLAATQAWHRRARRGFGQWRDGVYGMVPMDRLEAMEESWDRSVVRGRDARRGGLQASLVGWLRCKRANGFLTWQAKTLEIRRGRLHREMARARGAARLWGLLESLGWGRTAKLIAAQGFTVWALHAALLRQEKQLADQTLQLRTRLGKAEYAAEALEGEVHGVEYKWKRSMQHMAASCLYHSTRLLRETALWGYLSAWREHVVAVVAMREIKHGGAIIDSQASQFRAVHRLHVASALRHRNKTRLLRSFTTWKESITGQLLVEEMENLALYRERVGAMLMTAMDRHRKIFSLQRNFQEWLQRTNA